MRDSGACAPLTLRVANDFCYSQNIIRYPILTQPLKKDTILGVLIQWRRKRDSNPRGVSPKRFSRPPRYDRFDIPAKNKIVQRKRLKIHALALDCFLLYPNQKEMSIDFSPPKKFPCAVRGVGKFFISTFRILRTSYPKAA